MEIREKETMRIGTRVLVEQPDKTRWFGSVARMPRPITGQLGVVTEDSGQDRIVPRGSKVSRLHVHDVGEVRYVCTHDADGNVWEILEHRWSLNNEHATLEELKEFGVMDEATLTDYILEDDAPEGFYLKPDLSRTGREL